MFNNFYKGKRVLITGHTGFKGSWLAIWLKQLGAEVYGYALDPVTPEDNFVACGVRDLVHHKIANICDAKLLNEYFLEVQPEIAFHLAAQSLVLKSYEDPYNTFQTNLMGVVNFFEAVRNTPSVAVAINITSDKCYDNKEWERGYRETDPMGGKDPYSASKGCSELITSAYTHSFFNSGAPCRIASVRAGNVIGGGDWAENRIVPDFFRAVIGEEKLKIRNPHATRPWQHVLEPLSGYLNLAADLFGNRDLGGAWNFGPNQDHHFTVIKVVNEMIGYGMIGEYELAEEKATFHEANRLSLDISKAVEVLRWKPVLSFEETIRFTVDGYLDQLRRKELLSSRREQIENYAMKARSQGVQWARA